MEIERRRAPASGLNLTPLVDVVFLLLLFFMLTFQMSAPAILVELPRSDTSDIAAPQGPTLTITARGELLLNGAWLPKAELAQRLRPLFETDDAAPLRIIADRAARVELLVEVMDQAKAAGCQAFDILTRP